MRPNTILDEAERLRELHAQGVRVPQVYLANEDYLLLEDCAIYRIDFEENIGARPAPEALRGCLLRYEVRRHPLPPSAAAIR